MKSTRLKPRAQNSSEQYLLSLIKEANPIFLRESNNYKKRVIPCKMSSTSSVFNERINKTYDPGMKDLNFNRWNVNKLDMLDFMKDNTSNLKTNKNLLRNVQDLSKLTNMERKFPTFQRYMGLPPRSILNDAHNKSTNPGYSRNWNGKPYFA